MEFKPKAYNSLSPYLIVDHAQKLAEQLKAVFDAEELRKYEGPDDSTIMHLELRIDDSVIMISDSTDDYPHTPPCCICMFPM